MDCPNCPTSHAQAARFCKRCGTPLHGGIDRLERCLTSPSGPLYLDQHVDAHLSGARMYVYREMMGVVLLASLVTAAFGRFAIALVLAAVALPAAVLTYIYDHGVWRESTHHDWVGPRALVGSGRRRRGGAELLRFAARGTADIQRIAFDDGAPRTGHRGAGAAGCWAVLVAPVIVTARPDVAQCRRYRGDLHAQRCYVVARLHRAAVGAHSPYFFVWGSGERSVRSPPYHLCDSGSGHGDGVAPHGRHGPSDSRKGIVLLAASTSSQGHAAGTLRRARDCPDSRPGHPRGLVLTRIQQHGVDGRGTGSGGGRCAAACAGRGVCASCSAQRRRVFSRVAPRRPPSLGRQDGKPRVIVRPSRSHRSEESRCHLLRKNQLNPRLFPTPKSAEGVDTRWGPRRRSSRPSR